MLMLHRSIRKEGQEMAARTKAAPVAAPPKPVSNSVADLVGDWVRQATEGFIATQKILLDLAAQQNALALTIVRERLGLFSPTLSKTATDLVGKGAHNLFGAQQALLDLLARQNEIVSDGLKPGVMGTPAEALADVMHRGLDNFIATQKDFLRILEDETEGAVKDFGDGKGFRLARVPDLARDEMRTFLESQRRFLGIVEEELLAKRKRTAEHSDGKGKRVDLFEMAKESVDAFVEAQQQLLDLASSQVDVNVKLAKEVFSPSAHKRQTTAFPELVKKSVDSFLAAQKALVEIASKPRKPVEELEAVGAGAR
jgi:hypothetical protein